MTNIRPHTSLTTTILGDFKKRTTCDGVTCGYDGWLCCPSGSPCVTDTSNQQVQCASGSNGGGWVYYTLSTWVAQSIESMLELSSAIGGVQTLVSEAATTDTLMYYTTSSFVLDLSISTPTATSGALETLSSFTTMTTALSGTDASAVISSTCSAGCVVTNTPPPESSKLSTGAIAGIAVGGAVVLGLLIGGLLFRRHKRMTAVRLGTGPTPMTSNPILNLD